VPHWRLFYHLVWATKGRAPLITPAIEPALYRFLRDRANEKFAVPLFVIGGMPDHVHILTALRPSIALADFVQDLKGSSSYFVTQMLGMPFQWQRGYGVFSVSEQDVPRVVAYIRRQKTHHARGNWLPAWEPPDETRG